MGIIFSRQCEYALQAVSYLAMKFSSGQMTSIKEISKELNIPYHFAGKILQKLARKGLLISQKGISGGFKLATKPDRITMYDVVEAMDGTEFLLKCVMGFTKCSSETMCSIHPEWLDIRDKICKMLKRANFEKVVSDMKKPAFV